MTLRETITTNHSGRLLREILSAELLLVATNIVRYRFALYLDQRPVGIYGIRSFGEKSIRAVRAWNATHNTWDPRSKLTVPCIGRQFESVHSGTAIELLELDQHMTLITDRVAFRAKKIKVSDVKLPGPQRELRFEEIDFSELEILG